MRCDTPVMSRIFLCRFMACIPSPSTGSVSFAKNVSMNSLYSFMYSAPIHLAPLVSATACKCLLISAASLSMMLLYFGFITTNAVFLDLASSFSVGSCFLTKYALYSSFCVG